MGPRTVLTIALVAATSGLLAGCGGGGSSGPVHSVTVTGTEMRFTPSELTLAPGRYRFHFINAGTVFHSLAVVHNGTPETAGEAGPGKSVDLNVATLEAGQYVMQCQEPGHLVAGMRGTITVRK
ncbi:MAG TPA: plastocyanin/azurin family copper-binding protein [Acidimicrobiia bacterium]|nr:plastocyanin/azurin family copper-binding protein [Acidimicrobiia bacterium]